MHRIVSTLSILAGFPPAQNLKAGAVTFEYHFCSSSPVRLRSSSTTISIYIMTMALLRPPSKKIFSPVIRKVSKRNVGLCDLLQSRTLSPRHQVHLEMIFLLLLIYYNFAMKIPCARMRIRTFYKSVCEHFVVYLG